MKKAVLFDLDGTLADTAADFIRIIQQICKELGRPIPAEDAIRAQVSEGARAMVQLVYPELNQDDATLLKYRQHFLDVYEQQVVVDTDLFAGMYPLLEMLEKENIPWGIVTNKPRYLTEKLLNELKLNTRCAVLVCPQDVKHTKPDPEPMYLAANTLNLSSEDIIYVGDHPRDIDAGNNANMLTILAAYGYLPPNMKDNLNAWGADIIVQNVEQLHLEIAKQIS